MDESLAALAEAIEVMTRLRGPGGCPWDHEQTHQSLAPYAIEEAHEVAEAAETGDPADLRDELGDLLLQVLFHAEIARAEGTFTLADVAASLVAKLRRRHPHVFAGAEAHTPAQVEANWESIKRAEAPRAHPLEGIPTSLPALMRAQKVLRRAGAPAHEPAPTPHLPAASPPALETPETIGADLLAVVRRAAAAGIDAEQALRGATRAFEARLTATPQPPVERA